MGTKAPLVLQNKSIKYHIQSLLCMLTIIKNQIEIRAIGPVFLIYIVLPVLVVITDVNLTNEF